MPVRRHVVSFDAPHSPGAKRRQWRRALANGDLNLNGEFPLTANGKYIGDQTWPQFARDLANIKTGAVTWITLSIGSSKEKAELDLTGGEMRVAAPVSTGKRNYPSNEIEQTAAVMAVLMSATQPLDAGAIAATFKQGRKATLKKVEAVLAALNNTGFLDTRDNGRTFLLRRAA